MSFTDAEKTAIRRFTGFGMFGNQATPNFGARFSTIYGLLEFKMINMLPTEEDVVRNVYLANLIPLEAAIPTTSDNLDTLQAAVWRWNPNEQRDRESLFRSWRLKLCGFMGIPAGPDLLSDDGRNIAIVYG